MQTTEVLCFSGPTTLAKVIMRLAEENATTKSTVMKAIIELALRKLGKMEINAAIKNAEKIKGIVTRC